MTNYIFYCDLMCEHVVEALGLEFYWNKNLKMQKIIEHIFDRFYQILIQISIETKGILPSKIENDEILTIVCGLVLSFRKVSNLKQFQSKKITINWFWDHVEKLLKQI